MTLKVLVDVAKHYWIALIACIVVCTGAGLAYGMTRPGTYKATAKVASSIDTATLKGQADIIAAAYKDAAVSASADVAAKTVRIVGDSPNAEKAIEGANEVAMSLATLAESMPDDVGNTTNPLRASVQTSLAEEASYTKKSKIYIALGFGSGVFIALCLVVFLASRRAPVCGEAELEEITHLPVLGVLPTRNGTSLLGANVVFSTEKVPQTICLIPANTASVRDTSTVLSDSLADVASREGAQDKPKVIACESLLESVDAAFAAHEAEATLLVVSEWTDSLKDVERALHELTIAKANVIGIVYVAS